MSVDGPEVLREYVGESMADSDKTCQSLALPTLVIFTLSQARVEPGTIER
jgi:hypothetical protein